MLSLSAAVPGNEIPIGAGIPEQVFAECSKGYQINGAIVQ